MEFSEGGRGIVCGPFLENPEGWGGHMKNPFRGGVWIFSGTTKSRTVSAVAQVNALFAFTVGKIWSLNYRNGAQMKLSCTGLLIIRGKKSEISRDLKRQIREENGRFCGIFAGIFGANFC